MKKFFLLTILCVLGVESASAQRIQQPLGRGVVVSTRNSERDVTSTAGTGTLVSWRKLADEPENTMYNLYSRPVGATAYTKINTQPIPNTCYELTSAPNNTEYAVTAIVNGIEGNTSQPFLYHSQKWSNVWFQFEFDNSVIKRNDYRTKYVWPMDTDGDGEIDAVVCDRLFSGAAENDDAENQEENTSSTSHKLQAYRLDGTLLWTIDMGPNVSICGGHNDMVVAYDINCDGKCEVVMRSSDGTRFWDKQNNTWGLFVGGSTTGDIDGDRIIDYRSQGKRNPNFFISIVDGITGKELTHAELNYNELTDGNDSYGRDNRADYMNANYAAMEGHYGIAYLDGIHPSLVMECENRDKNGTHHGYVMTWDFDWDGGVASNWHHSHTWTRNNKSPLCAEFHQIRIIDSDGDGCDDMWTGSYGVNPKQNRFVTTGLPHGDRFILSDIDPERPGLEGFSIQQSALLGQCLYDISNGQRLREWHLPSVYDVGRGACMDIDPDNKGYEIYSFTDDYIYDCKGYKTAHTRSQNGITTMFEGLWWDGNLLREELSSPGGSGYSTNLMVTTVLGKKRLIEFSQESEWDVHGGTGTRPAFMGDIIGDWREEVILAIQRADSSTGLVGYTTNIPTNHSIYSLQQDPHYRLDCTTRGYYQHPNTGFYLGTEMPLPPLPPILKTDLRWKGGSWENGFISYDMKSNCNYSDGKSLMFDLSGDNSAPIVITNKITPSAICLMNPKGHDYIFNDVNLAGNMTLTKSMLGTVVLNGNLSYTGKTIISEGNLIINGNIDSPIELRAKGTLGGNVTVRSDISFEGALNHEGCRLMPTGNNGVISFNKDLILPGNIYIELEAGNGTCGKLAINGNLDFKGVNTFTINGNNLTAGNYVLAECTNALNADIANLMIRGLEGVNYELKKEANQLVLVVKETRSASSNVIWTGLESNEWNYKANNFTLNGTGTSFVANDEVVFNDKSSKFDITIDDMVKPASIVFESGTYTFSGDGGISGEGHVTINKNANVTFNLDKSDYTGATIVNGGTLIIPNIYNGGQNSAIGASSAAVGNLQLNGGKLVLSKDNMATDHIILITDTATISISQKKSSLSLKRQVMGSGYLIKDGPGQLNFSFGGSNTFAGLIVKEGIVAQGAWNTTFGREGGPMLLCGGEINLMDMNNMSARPKLNHRITVAEGTSSIIRGTTRGSIEGSFHGTGNVTIYSTGVRNDIGADFSQFRGTLHAEGSNFRLMDNVTDMSQTYLVMGDGCNISHYNSNGSTQRAITTSIGSLAASSSAKTATLGHSQDSYEIGGLDEDMTFYGLLKAKHINKVGNGKLSLRSAGHTSSISVNGGILEFNGINTTAMISGLITVNNGGTLSGKGYVSDVIVNRGGTLAAGIMATVPGVMRMKSLKLNQGANIRCVLSGTGSNSRFNVVENIEHNGDTLTIVVPANRKLSEGEELTIFPTGFTSATGNVIIKCDSEADINYKFDTSTLNTDGKIRVTSVVSNIQPTYSSNALVNVYSIDGKILFLQEPLQNAINKLGKGIYIISDGNKRIKITK